MEDIEVIGYYHSGKFEPHFELKVGKLITLPPFLLGTVAEFMTMDKPSGYVCRLSRTSQYQVPTTVKEIVKLLRLLSICLKMKSSRICLLWVSGGLRLVSGLV
ncbi:unnamed protein product [Absidia cylindrospora]